MADLIKREDAIGNINRRRYHFGRAALNEAFKAVYKAPSVDAVVVVRCKECSCAHPCEKNDNRVWCLKFARSMANEWFCADGERKEDSNDTETA